MITVPPDVPGQTALYRLVDAFGCPLYIGVSGALAARIKMHAYDKPWWPEVASISAEWHDDRAAAIEAEAEAIRRERPAYNLSGVAPRHRSQATAAPSVPDWGPTDLPAIATLAAGILASRDISHAHARLRTLNLLLTGRDELPRGQQLRALASQCGVSTREAYRALEFQRGEWPDGWSHDVA